MLTTKEGGHDAKSLQGLKGRETIQRRKNLKERRARGVKGTSDSSDGDDNDCSIQSAMLDSDNSGDSSNDDDDNSDCSSFHDPEDDLIVDLVPRRKRKEFQDACREERLKRRQSRMKVQQPQQHPEKKTRREKEVTDECDGNDGNSSPLSMDNVEIMAQSEYVDPSGITPDDAPSSSTFFHRKSEDIDQCGITPDDAPSSTLSLQPQQEPVDLCGNLDINVEIMAQSEYVDPSGITPDDAPSSSTFFHRKSEDTDQCGIAPDDAPSSTLSLQPQQEPVDLCGNLDDVPLPSTSSLQGGHFDRGATPDDVPSSLHFPVDIKPGKRKGKNVHNFDVLHLAGGAAQITTHPGNLHFHKLCDERYDEWLDAIADTNGSQVGRRILEEIVDDVIARGGVFRKKTGGKMTYYTAVEKARDRMRMLRKPKVRPRGNYGENDVVFARGGANILYPGNVKWKSLMDQYVASYYRDVMNVQNQEFDDDPNCCTAILRNPERFKRKSDGRFFKGKKNERRRPAYQYDIIGEIIRTIHSRGGKFRDRRLNELTDAEVEEKTHSRFKDMKKELIAGTRAWCSLTNTTVLTKGGGFAGASLQRLKRRETIQRRTNLRHRPTRGVKGRNESSDDDDDCSFQSAMLDSDESRDSSNDDDENSDCSSIYDPEDELVIELASRRKKKEFQDQGRKERLKRRQSGIKVQQPQQRPEKKRKRRKEVRDECNEDSSPPPPDHPLSEYELYRLKKIQRNKAKLAELGLVGN